MQYLACDGVLTVDPLACSGDWVALETMEHSLQLAELPLSEVAILLGAAATAFAVAVCIRWSVHAITGRR